MIVMNYTTCAARSDGVVYYRNIAWGQVRSQQKLSLLGYTADFRYDSILNAMERRGKVDRKTSEVDVSIDISLDGKGKYNVETGIPFFDHMLAQFAKHGYFDLTLRAKGDVEVDFHHTVEDVGLTLGEAFLNALGDKKGISRFGEAFVPFDEALVFASVDLSGRPYFVYRVSMPKGKIGDFDAELGEEFFKSLSNTLKCNLHIELRYGYNLHHIIEAAFKAVGRALDKASSIDPRSEGIPSTKGKL